jgi:hypothetical protein
MSMPGNGLTINLAAQISNSRNKETKKLYKNKNHFLNFVNLSNREAPHLLVENHLANRHFINRHLGDTVFVWHSYDHANLVNYQLLDASLFKDTHCMKRDLSENCLLTK